MRHKNGGAREPLSPCPNPETSAFLVSDQKPFGSRNKQRHKQKFTRARARTWVLHAVTNQDSLQGRGEREHRPVHQRHHALRSDRVAAALDDLRRGDGDNVRREGLQRGLQPGPRGRAERLLLRVPWRTNTGKPRVAAGVRGLCLLLKQSVVFWCSLMAQPPAQEGSACCVRQSVAFDARWLCSRRRCLPYLSWSSALLAPPLRCPAHWFGELSLQLDSPRAKR